MMQITLRCIDKPIQLAIRNLVRTEGISVNKAVLRLLRRAIQGDTRPKGVIGNSLDQFFGVWTKAESEEFRRAVADTEKIDPEMWK